MIAGTCLVSPRPGVAETTASGGRIAAGGVVRVHVPEAVGGKTVVGELTVDGAVGAGFVTAYGCASGLPVSAGVVTRSDLNYDGRLNAVASNRLLVKADDNGDVCLFTLGPAALIVDVNAVTFDTGVNSFPNRRTDTRAGPLVGAGRIERIRVPEAQGAKTVVGQLTVDRAAAAGFVTAFACAAGLPVDAAGRVSRSDLNYAGGAARIASNRLIVQADADGDVCLYTLQPVAMIVDVNGVADVGINSFASRRTDTRTGPTARVAAGSVTRVAVPEAAGRKTVLGQVTVDRATNGGYVTAYGCDDGIPMDVSGAISRSDVNFEGAVSPVASNRLIVQADDQGDVCLFTSQPAALVVDVNGVSGAGISSFPNRRFDTRNGTVTDTATGIGADGSRTWPPFQPAPALAGVAALTGRAAEPAVTARPILAVKIDNYATARPQWGLESADAVIEVNVEGISRFIALFQSRLPSVIGPVRSARTEDFDLLSTMNRPIFAYSGANDGVLQWAVAADSAGVIADLGAQHAPCYSRSPDKPGPHNLLLDSGCAHATAAMAGAARPLWRIDARPTPPAGVPTTRDTSFDVAMDGVTVQWRWDPTAGVYRRWQDGAPHVTMTNAALTASTVAVLAVPYVPSVIDERSPDAITVGTGTAAIHRNGRAIDAIWSRATPYAPFQFYDPRTGVELAADAGVTWLELTRA
jgi:hypothetical protein